MIKLPMKIFNYNLAWFGSKRCQVQVVCKLKGSNIIKMSLKEFQILKLFASNIVNKICYCIFCIIFQCNFVEINA